MFKTSAWKYVAPQILENAFKQSRFIEQIMVIGDGEKNAILLFIQPNFEFVTEWAHRHNLKYYFFLLMKNFFASKMVIDKIQEEIDHCNEKFGNWEKVKRLNLPLIFGQSMLDTLTPTMKLKRKIIKEKYNDLYQKIYG